LNILARQLINGLTSEQLVKLVTQLLDNMTETERTRFGDLLDPDISSVFRRLLDHPTTTTADETSEITSDARFAQQFAAKLSDIECLLFDLGDEDGEYIYQDRHWDPPDFDALKLASDIERYARDLLPLLDHASELELEDKDWFMNLCQQITDGIKSYPEYIYTKDGVCFEHMTTECVLKWLDLHADSEASFVNDLVAFMDDAGYISLDDAAIRKYMLEGWDDNRRRALYHAIQEHRSSNTEFKQDTDNPRALWYQIRYALAGEFDIAGKAEIAETSVAKDWTKGIELVDAAVADGNAIKALEFCRKTVDAYFNCNYGQKYSEFDPGTNPLLGQYSMVDEPPTVPRILKIWAVLAAGDGDTVLAEYLTIQEALLARTDNWTSIKHAFDKAESADTSILFSSWKKQALDQQNSSMYLGGSTQHPSWVEWLLDAGFANSFEAFTEKAAPWLNEKIKPVKKKGKNLFAQQRDFAWPPQMSLAADLFALDTAPTEYPTLKAMLLQHCKLNDCPARLEWLGNTNVSGLTSASVAFVNRNMARLIPSPDSSMGGGYETAAGWLAAAREVAPEAARETLRHWQDEYKRRRNLWRDLRTHGFDV